MKILITGHAGFIGFHTAKRLLERGDSVVGIDSLNDYYDPKIKQDRLSILDAISDSASGEYCSIQGNITDKALMMDIFSKHLPDRVINLAAQAGVRYSITNPEAYVESNLIGFTNLLEACRHHGKPHLTYASTSSVYGANTKLPFSESDGTNHPLQFYAATKKANELMAHSYSHLFKLPTTGLRFFTVYGPWGRPDMALFMFTKNILAGEPIQVFNNGNHTRDFTYVEDIVEGVIRASDQIAESDLSWDSSAPNPSTSSAPYRIFNIGNNNPVSLMLYIQEIEKALNKKAIVDFKPLQLGDVPDTYADTRLLEKAVDYIPATSVQEGVSKFVQWYLDYFKA